MMIKLPRSESPSIQEADQRFMRRAIEIAQGNPAAPFATVLVDRRTGDIVAEGLNRGHDSPIFHGEMDAINRYAQTAGDAWSFLQLYTTAEPCCMCQGAIVWAGIEEVLFGTSIPRLVELGWRQIDIRAVDVVLRTPFSQCSVRGGILDSECDALFTRSQDLAK